MLSVSPTSHECVVQSSFSVIGPGESRSACMHFVAVRDGFLHLRTLFVFDEDTERYYR